MSFGFSVGDFIAALELVGTIIQALRESGGAGSQYRELINELYGLELALLQVKQLELEEEQRAEYIALRLVASNCQQSIVCFWSKISKYQEHLRSEGPKSKLRDRWMKVMWALCTSGDVASFKTDIAAHSLSIKTLLAAIYLKQSNLQDKKRTNEFKTLSRSIQELTLQCMEKLGSLTTNVGDGLLSGIQILENTFKILRTNVQIFQVVCMIQKIVTRIPNQIDRQQPVYMIDAVGRMAPFYLEFIRSSEAFKAVLKINFAKVPSGVRKIEGNQFVIQDIATQRQINLSDDWDTCFQPGQRVEMRVLFNRTTRHCNRCPTCKAKCSKRIDGDVECSRCGLLFRRLVEIQEPPSEPTMAPRKASVKEHAEALILGPTTIDAWPDSKAKTAYDEAEDIKFYRRVKVLEIRRKRVWQEDTHTPESQGGYYDLPPELDNDLQPADDSIKTKVQNAHILGGDIGVDMQIFEQILDMDDDDDDDGEFSRLVILETLERLDEGFEEVEACIGEMNFDKTHKLLHYYRGISHSIGLTNLRECLGKIYWYQRDEEETDSEVQAAFKAALGTAREQYEVANSALRKFYKSEA